MGQKVSKRELSLEQRHCVTLGLYPHYEWDPRIIRNAICSKKLAPIFKGAEDQGGNLEECPICFLYYPGGLNRSKCCKKGLCTECYLQLRPPNKAVPCPYCNAAVLEIIFTGPKSSQELQKELEEEQKVIEAEIRIRHNSKSSTSGSEAEMKGINIRVVEDPLSHYHSPPGSLDFLPKVPPPPEKFSSAPHNNPNMNRYFARDANELEEFMIREAIRRSLLESSSANTSATGEVLIPESGSSTDSFFQSEEDDESSSMNSSYRTFPLPEDVFPVSPQSSSQNNSSNNIPVNEDYDLNFFDLLDNARANRRRS